VPGRERRPVSFQPKTITISRRTASNPFCEPHTKIQDLSERVPNLGASPSDGLLRRLTPQ
jgi:hypothetical protein